MACSLRPKNKEKRKGKEAKKGKGRNGGKERKESRKVRSMPALRGRAHSIHLIQRLALNKPPSLPNEVLNNEHIIVILVLVSGQINAR